MQTDSAATFLQQVRVPWKFRLYLLKHLPSAFFMRLRLEEVRADYCQTSLPYNWWNKNPFRSIYFAVLSAGAELASGIPAAAAVYKQEVSMLMTHFEISFVKKATARVWFTCSPGAAYQEAVRATRQTGEARVVKADVEGRLADGTLVCRATVEWSFKRRSRK